VDCYATLRRACPEPYILHFFHDYVYRYPVHNDISLNVYWEYGGMDVIVAEPPNFNTFGSGWNQFGGGVHREEPPVDMD
jgi:hypothetical protein